MMAATLPSTSSSFYIIARISPEELLTVSCTEATKADSTEVIFNDSYIFENRVKAYPAKRACLPKRTHEYPNVALKSRGPWTEKTKCPFLNINFSPAVGQRQHRQVNTLWM